MQKKEYSLDLGGKEVIAEFNDLADQAGGSVMMKCDNTVVLATAVMSKDGRDNRGWFNLTVEYMEKFYAGGEILGARFTRREGRPSDNAVLSSRIIDRTIRPLFEKHIKNAVQVIVSVISLGDFDPTTLAINAASVALATSDIPWNGPIGCVAMRRAHNDEKTTLNRYKKETTHPDTAYAFDMIMCGQAGTLNMIEAGAYEASEEQVGAVMEEAVPYITQLENWQKEIVAEIGKEKRIIEKPELPAEVISMFESEMLGKLKSDLFGPDSKKNIYALEDVWKELVEEKYPDDSDEHKQVRSLAKDHYHHMVDEAMHEAALKEDKRADLRKMDEVRNLYAQAGGISPLIHGSGIFYRGGTHVMSFLALGGPDDRLETQGMEEKGQQRYFHHYNFPPFSAGETGRVGGFNRRQIGHGKLAQKALVPVLPTTFEFPYTMRVVSESVASNGSTSQASICGSSLALMDGGVPIKRHVAGIAMGLMIDQSDASTYKILTDIQGPEDHHGDMDFKVAGTREGVTAIQLDIKVDGIPVKILQEALQQAEQARLGILDVMEAEIAKSRADINPNAPKIVMIDIEEDQIGMIIGSGGKTIQKLQEDTQTTITIEDDGSVFITGKGDGPDKAKEIIAAMTREWKVGETTEGEVVKIIEVGAIVKISPTHDGLVHVSEIANFRVANVRDVLKEGMTVPVVITAVDKEKNRISFSIEKAKPGFIKKPDAPEPTASPAAPAK